MTGKKSGYWFKHKRYGAAQKSVTNEKMEKRCEAEKESSLFSESGSGWSGNSATHFVDSSISSEVCRQTSHNSCVVPEVCYQTSHDSIVAPEVCRQTSHDSFVSSEVCRQTSDNLVVSSEVCCQTSDNLVVSSEVCCQTSHNSFVTSEVCCQTSRNSFVSPEVCRQTRYVPGGDANVNRNISEIHSVSGWGRFSRLVRLKRDLRRMVDFPVSGIRPLFAVRDNSGQIDAGFELSVRKSISSTTLSYYRSSGSSFYYFDPSGYSYSGGNLPEFHYSCEMRRDFLLDKSVGSVRYYTSAFFGMQRRWICTGGLFDPKVCRLLTLPVLIVLIHFGGAGDSVPVVLRSRSSNFRTRLMDRIRLGRAPPEVA